MKTQTPPISRYRDVVLVFIITAFWDVVLRYISEGYIQLFGVEKMKWVTVLREYFQYHTPLSAALIAGFVGAMTYVVINATNPFKPGVMYVGWIALVSGLVGPVMYHSGLFPVLNTYYYDRLSWWESFASDANSGVVVALSYWFLCNMKDVRSMISRVDSVLKKD